MPSESGSFFDRIVGADELSIFRARLSLAMSAGHMGIFDWDLGTNQIAWIGQHESLFGMAPGSFDGRYESFARCVHPDDLPELERRIAHTRQTRSTYEYEYRVIWPDRSIHWIVGRGHFIYDDQGNALRMLGVVIDVTPRHDAEDAARQQQAHIAHLSRLHILSQITAGLAHELNQPLSAISAFVGAALQLRQSNRLPPERLDEFLKDIQQQAVRAGTIIRRLRDFMRDRPPQVELIDLNTVAADALDLMIHELRNAEVRFELAPMPGPCLVRVDPIQIQQVLVNIIQNAIEAMAGVAPHHRRLTIRISTENDRAAIEVVDTGGGLDTQTAARIFDSFFSTKPQGLGLGLTISRSIVERFGGSLTAHGRSEGGARLVFHLPLAEERTP